MTAKKIPGGVVHTLPSDIKNKIQSSSKMLSTWEDITPLARNEWICWITSAKKDETRDKRLRRAHEDLSKGKRRPCCWAGCPHR